MHLAFHADRAKLVAAILLLEASSVRAAGTNDRTTAGEESTEEGTTPSHHPKRSEEEGSRSVDHPRIDVWGSGLGEDSREGSQLEPTSFSGFYLRLALGGGTGWADAKATADQPLLAIQAWTSNAIIQHGYRFSKSFALHADLYGAFSQARSIDNDEELLGYVPSSTRLFMMTLGPGFSFHTRTEDLFVSAGGGLAAAYGTQWRIITERVRLTTAEQGITNPGYGGHGARQVRPSPLPVRLLEMASVRRHFSSDLSAPKNDARNGSWKRRRGNLLTNPSPVSSVAAR